MLYGLFIEQWTYFIPTCHRQQSDTIYDLTQRCQETTKTMTDRSTLDQSSCWVQNLLVIYTLHSTLLDSPHSTCTRSYLLQCQSISQCQRKTTASTYVAYSFNDTYKCKLKEPRNVDVSSLTCSDLAGRLIALTGSPHSICDGQIRPNFSQVPAASSKTSTNTKIASLQILGARTCATGSWQCN